MIASQRLAVEGDAIGTTSAYRLEAGDSAPKATMAFFHERPAPAASASRAEVECALAGPAIADRSRPGIRCRRWR